MVGKDAKLEESALAAVFRQLLESSDMSPADRDAAVSLLESRQRLGPATEEEAADRRHTAAVSRALEKEVVIIRPHSGRRDSAQRRGNRLGTQAPVPSQIIEYEEPEDGS